MTNRCCDASSEIAGKLCEDNSVQLRKFADPKHDSLHFGDLSSQRHESNFFQCVLLSLFFSMC